MNEDAMMTVTDARVLLETMNACCKGLLLTKDETIQIANICLKAIRRAESKG